MARSDQILSLQFDFDSRLFRLSAITKAAYRFTEAFTVTTEQLPDSLVRVTLTLREGHAPVRFDPRSLPNEVLDQELREKVAEETKSVRDLLLAQAFSGLSIVDSVGENADYHDDPLGIAAPHTIPGKRHQDGA